MRTLLGAVFKSGSFPLGRLTFAVGAGADDDRIDWEPIEMAPPRVGGTVKLRLAKVPRELFVLVDD